MKTAMKAINNAEPAIAYILAINKDWHLSKSN